MSDPLTEIVSLLKPRAPYSKVVSATGAWAVRRTGVPRPFYCVILEGSTRLFVDEVETPVPLVLERGDFVLVPSAHDSIMSSLVPYTEDDFCTAPVQVGPGSFRIGQEDIAPDVRLLIGYCSFGSPDADLLVSLLPNLVHVRGEQRLATIVQLVGDETRATRPGRDVVLERLLEVLLIEALRSSAGPAARPGLLRGLADVRLATAIRRMHESPTHGWTVAQLAKEAALSRSAFFERFSRAVGVAPMEYLLGWRMAMAKNLLRLGGHGIGEVAEQVGYRSASTFSVAFARHVGVPPTHYAREQSLAANAPDLADTSFA